MAVDRARAAAAIREFLAACGLAEDDPRLTRTPARVAAAAEELFAGEGADPVPALREGRISVDASADAAADAAAGNGAWLDGAPSTSGAPDGVAEGDAAAEDPGEGDGPGAEDGAASPADADVPVPAEDAVGNLVLVRNVRFRSMCEHHLLPFDGWVHLAYLPGDSIIGFGRLYDLVETVSSRLSLQERLGEDLVEAIMEGLDALGALAVVEARQGCVADRGPRQADSDSVTLAARGSLRDPQARADALRLISLGGQDRE